jgi:hypothetical protein
MSYRYQVVKNRPVTVFPGRPPKYPFRRMKVGDSFKFPKKEYVKVFVAASKWKSRHPGESFSVSKADLCCWRIG